MHICIHVGVMFVGGSGQQLESGRALPLYTLTAASVGASRTDLIGRTPYDAEPRGRSVNSREYMFAVHEAIQLHLNPFVLPVLMEHSQADLHRIS